MKLRTERLLLTLVDFSDIPDFQRYQNADPSLARALLLHQRYRDVEFGARRFFYDEVRTGHAIQDKLYLAVRLPGEPQRLIGLIAFQRFSRTERIWYLRYWLHAGYRKQGYMAEATCAAMFSMFETGVVETLQCHIHAENLDSCNLTQRQGFRIISEPELNSLVWNMTAEDFLTRHAA